MGTWEPRSPPGLSVGLGKCGPQRALEEGGGRCQELWLASHARLLGRVEALSLLDFWGRQEHFHNTLGDAICTVPRTHFSISPGGVCELAALCHCPFTVTPYSFLKSFLQTRENLVAKKEHSYSCNPPLVHRLEARGEGYWHRWFVFIKTALLF